LEGIASLLRIAPTLRLKIVGYASKEGEHYVNPGVSNARANAVKDYLVSKGIDKNCLQVSYFGSDELLANDTAKRATNRRVEMKLYH